MRLAVDERAAAAGPLVGKSAGVARVNDMARPILQDSNQYREHGFEIARIIGALLCSRQTHRSEVEGVTLISVKEC
jgi:hypothetical protein